MEVIKVHLKHLSDLFIRRSKKILFQIAQKNPKKFPYSYNKLQQRESERKEQNKKKKLSRYENEAGQRGQLV